MVKLNETPVRTSRNFNINNIKLENINIPEVVSKFENIRIFNETEKNKITSEIENIDITYGINSEFINQVKQNSNYNIKINIESKQNKDIKLDFLFDKDNLDLIDNIQILAEEGTKATIYLKYESEKDLESFHNEIIKIFAKKIQI